MFQTKADIFETLNFVFFGVLINSLFVLFVVFCLIGSVKREREREREKGKRKKP